MAMPEKRIKDRTQMLTDRVGVRLNREYDHTQLVSAYKTPTCVRTKPSTPRPDALDLQSSILAAMQKFDA